MSYHLAKQKARHDRKIWRQSAVVAMILVLLLAVVQIGGFAVHPGVDIVDALPRLRAGALDDVSRKDLLATLQLYQHEEAISGADQDRITVLEQQLQQYSAFTADSQPVLLAGVSKPPQYSLYQTFVIDRGTSHGVLPGQRVAANGVLLGTVAQVYETSAVVRLLSTDDENIVRVFASGEVIKIGGAGTGNYRSSVLRHVSADAGDILVDLSLEQMIVGVIEDVIFDPRDPAKEIIARVPVNLDNVAIVELWPPAPPFDFTTEGQTDIGQERTLTDEMADPLDPLEGEVVEEVPDIPRQPLLPPVPESGTE